MRSAKYLQSRQARENRMGSSWKRGWRFLQANQPHSAKQSKNEHKTPLCNRPSGIYILTGFSVRLLFCLFQTYTHDMCWICKICTGEATNWPGKIKGFTRYRGRLNFHWLKRKINSSRVHWLCYRGGVTRQTVEAHQQIRMPMVSLPGFWLLLQQPLEDRHYFTYFMNLITDCPTEVKEA